MYRTEDTMQIMFLNKLFVLFKASAIPVNVATSQFHSFYLCLHLFDGRFLSTYQAVSTRLFIFFLFL